MNFSYFIARRYLFSKKSRNAINLITWIAIVGITVGTAALIIVLSVFNGLTHFIENLFSALDPDIKIVASAGLYMEEDPQLVKLLESEKEILSLTRTIEGQIILQYIDNQAFGVLKGVDDNFTTVNPLDSYVYEGDYELTPKARSGQAVIGTLLAASLSTDRYDSENPILLSHIPNDAPNSAFSLIRSVRNVPVFPSGYFSIQKEYDEKFIISDFEYVRDFLDLPKHLSAYEMKLKDIKKADLVKKRLEKQIPPEYEVLTWYDQHQTLFRVMRNEKYISFLILALMLAIAAVNIVGSLTMIVLEKTRDIAVLKSMGMTLEGIRRIFLLEGTLVGGIGVSLGMLIAFLFGLVQQNYGVIRFYGGESFRVTAFPMDMQWGDFALTFFTVLGLSVLASLYPSRHAARVHIASGLKR